LTKGRKKRPQKGKDKHDQQDDQTDDGQPVADKAFENQHAR
jgi:hypothetical protein